MINVVKVEPRGNYTLWLQFSDGLEACIDIKPFIAGGISAALRDVSYFNAVSVDSMGGVCWENGFDFCPVTLRGLAGLSLEAQPALYPIS